MKIPASKFKAILLYFCQNTDPKFLGKVKLMKLFYFLDFIHLKRFGLPVTFDDYYHLQKGPIPTLIKNMIDEAVENTEESDLSDTVYFKTPDGTVMNQCIAVREFTDEDKKLFTESEIEVLEEVCTRFGKYTTDQIVRASHSEAAWSKTEYVQQIPFELAADDPDSNFTREEIRLLVSSMS